MKITIKDETLTGDVIDTIELNVADEQLTVKDIIAARVEAEVTLYNKKLPEYFKGLVKPTEAEKTLNGYKLKDRKRLVDIEKQVFVALDAFQKNGYFVLIDNNQAESLEQQVQIHQHTTISFVKLTPLVGG